MRYKRSSRIARHFVSPGFWPFASKIGFFHRHIPLQPVLLAFYGSTPRNQVRHTGDAALSQKRPVAGMSTSSSPISPHVLQADCGRAAYLARIRYILSNSSLWISYPILRANLRKFPRLCQFTANAIGYKHPQTGYGQHGTRKCTALPASSGWFAHELLLESSWHRLPHNS
jgi:hypothetical protein